MTETVERIEGTDGRRVTVTVLTEFGRYRATLDGDGAPVSVDHRALKGARVWGRLACGAVSTVQEAVASVAAHPLVLPAMP